MKPRPSVHGHFVRTATFVLALAALAASQEMPSSIPIAESGISGGRMLGLGGRITWMQRPLADPRIWLDGHLFLQPLPRLFLEGGWGKADQTIRGSGSDTSFSETRWDLTLGVVLLPGSAMGYVPVLWRKVSQRHSWIGDAEWTEIGTGAGALVPVRDWLSLQTETMWVFPLDAHPDISLGQGRETEGGHLEWSLSFLIFVK